MEGPAPAHNHGLSSMGHGCRPTPRETLTKPPSPAPSLPPLPPRRCALHSLNYVPALTDEPIHLYKISICPPSVPRCPWTVSRSRGTGGNGRRKSFGPLTRQPQHHPATGPDPTGTPVHRYRERSDHPGPRGGRRSGNANPRSIGCPPRPAPAPAMTGRGCGGTSPHGIVGGRTPTSPTWPVCSGRPSAPAPMTTGRGPPGCLPPPERAHGPDGRPKRRPHA